MSCDNLKKDRIRCEACRTINLAVDQTPPRPNMQMYQKRCAPVCPKATELPLNPTCIKVCDIDDLRIKKIVPKKVVQKHGKLMYGVKAGILLGAVYFTYQQGIWGDQVAVTEATRRWREYVRSFHTRRPPVFDECGKVVTKETTDSIIAPLYALYKGVITNCFTGVVKFPLVVKCMYLDYLKAMELKEQELIKSRKINK